MPKKFGTNSKKEEAREKSKEKKKQERDQKQKEAENEFWKETDEKVTKKLEKEKEKEKKKQDAIKRKQENKELAEKEMEELEKGKVKENKAPTRREIQEHKERTLKKLLEDKAEKEEKNEIDEIDVEKEFVNENYGKLNQVTTGGKEVVDLTGVDDALNELSVTDYDKHPEKRMRAAWKEYMEKQMPLFKVLYPGAKRSQLIEFMQKEFKKSPENPVYKQQMAGK
jgi:hypothetical protein